MLLNRLLASKFDISFHFTWKRKTFRIINFRWHIIARTYVYIRRNMNLTNAYRIVGHQFDLKSWRKHLNYHLLFTEFKIVSVLTDLMSFHKQTYSIAFCCTGRFLDFFNFASKPTMQSSKYTFFQGDLVSIEMLRVWVETNQRQHVLNSNIL